MSVLCCSLNQVEHTARKAVRGVGLSWGLAEDAGRATRWSQAGGLDGVGALVALLSQIPQDITVSDSVIRTPDGWRITSPTGCLLAAAAVADGVIAGSLDPEQDGLVETILLQAVPAPVILIGFAGVAATQSGRPIWLRWPGISVQCEINTIAADRELSVLRAARDVDVQVSLKPFAQGESLDTVKLKYGASNVDDSDWKRLEAWASRTYVPATEQSRLSGAGAGVSDND